MFQPWTRHLGCLRACPDRRPRKGGAQRLAGRVGHPDEPQDDRTRADGRGKFGIVGRQRVESAGKDRILRSGALQELLRRQPVHFGHQDIDADRGGLVLLDVANEFGQNRPRPRPLPERRKALLVDLDHDGGRRLDLARSQHLKRVEPEGLQARRPPRFHAEQHRHDSEEQ